MVNIYYRPSRLFEPPVRGLRIGVSTFGIFKDEERLK